MSMTELRCPPCTGDCQQGRVCPAWPQLTTAERARLERTWTLVDLAMAAALVAFVAAVAVLA
jgi:hypothetical protein